MSPAPTAAATTVSEALATRRSVRAFLPTPVPRELVERLLALASLSASNSNSQPWRVHVVTGAAKQRLTQDLLADLDAGRRAPQPGYDYQPPSEEWPEPHRGRRVDFGDQLYRRALGIEHDDTAGRDRHHRRNYAFFDAPVGIVLTTSTHLRDGALLDAGLFLQALMLAAREQGLHTCPQASFVDFHRVLRRHLTIPDDETVVCGVALGHADRDHPADTVRTPRVPVAQFATFHGDDATGDDEPAS